MKERNGEMEVSERHHKWQQILSNGLQALGLCLGRLAGIRQGHRLITHSDVTDEEQPTGG